MRDLSPLDRFPRHLVETGPGSVGNPGTHPILLPSGRRILVLMRSCSRLGEKSWYSPHPAPGRTKNPGTRAERASIRPQIAGTTPNEPPVPVLPTQHAVRESPANHPQTFPIALQNTPRPIPRHRRKQAAHHPVTAEQHREPRPITYCKPAPAKAASRPPKKPPRAPTLTLSPRQTKLPAHEVPLTD